MAIPFDEGKHQRGPGGLFAAQSAAGGKPTGAWVAGPLRRGSGRRGQRDPRAVAAQKQLNALGFGDERGRSLLEDGVVGAHTEAAIKRWQSANGMAPTGVLDAKAMVALLSAKPKPKQKQTARSMMSRRHSAPAGKRPKTTTSKPAAAQPVQTERGRGFSRFGATAST